MSRKLLRDTVSPLPPRLRDDVLSYASFVEGVVDERAAALDVKLSAKQRDEVVFIAGIIHVRELVAGQLTLARLATGQADLTANVKGLRIGRDDLTRSSRYVTSLRSVDRKFTQLFRDVGLPVTASRLSDAIQFVADDNG